MDEPEFHGYHVDFDDVDAHPRPTSVSGPPVIIGGLSDAARRRAIRTANGWFPYNTTVESTRELVDVIARETKEIGRPSELGPLELTIIPDGALNREMADQYEELGVARIVVLPRLNADTERPHIPVPVDEIKRTIDLLAAELDL
jgi:alkanesulfonate monooxygenase SsuD/methylene tetrahydromethanopterin reductase-like flavin-dependent oxidoreductase (luciferase family)